ncbi:hypothetical protein ES703_22808 [subsurface metagenome]
MYKRKVSFAGKKKGVSVMVSYVLLIVFVIIIGALVYQWLKSYVPAQALECPDGVSIFIKEANFDPFDSRLIVTLRNNGRFSLAGYFIHATNSSDQELPTIDLSGYLNKTKGPGIIFGNSVLFLATGDNFFHPGSERSYFFDLPSSIGEPYSIRITPTRFQDVNEKQRFVSCSDARAGQLVGEVVGECIPDCTGRVCGPDPVCGISCGTCAVEGEVCDGTGQCVPVEECTDTCLSLGYECGIWEICGDITDCPPGCTLPEVCNVITGQCVSNVNNGICDPEETCADSDCEGQQNGCLENQICLLGSCVLDIPGDVADCGEYCVFLGSYIGGHCRQNQAQCEVNLEVYESGGNQYCTVPLTNSCCCVPA